MIECQVPQWVFTVIDWFNNGIIDGTTMGNILKYFYDHGYCIVTGSV